MEYTILQSYIKKVTKNVSDEDLSLLVSCAVSRKLKKGESLLKEGELCRSFYFVDEGYLRTYYNKEGVTINLNFTFEGEFTTNIKSIKSRKPSEIIIEAGENASVLLFNLNTIAEKFNANPIINLFIRRLAVHLLLASEEQNNLFKIYTPTERYRYIEINNPQLLQRVSLSQMASYLGVARETLSRIRGKSH